MKYANPTNDNDPIRSAFGRTMPGPTVSEARGVMRDSDEVPSHLAVETVQFDGFTAKIHPTTRFGLQLEFGSCRTLNPADFIPNGEVKIITASTQEELRRAFMEAEAQATTKHIRIRGTHLEPKHLWVARLIFHDGHEVRVESDSRDGLLAKLLADYAANEARGHEAIAALTPDTYLDFQNKVRTLADNPNRDKAYSAAATAVDVNIFLQQQPRYRHTARNEDLLVQWHKDHGNRRVTLQSLNQAFVELYVSGTLDTFDQVEIPPELEDEIDRIIALRKYLDIPASRELAMDEITATRGIKRLPLPVAKVPSPVEPTEQWNVQEVVMPDEKELRSMDIRDLKQKVNLELAAKRNRINRNHQF